MMINIFSEVGVVLMKISYQIKWWIYSYFFKTNM